MIILIVRHRGRSSLVLDRRIYNGLVQKRLRIDEAFAQIEVQLKRRHDLIPNLVNAVKGYMGFEQKVLTDVTNARAAAVAAGAQGPAQQAAAENALTGTLRSLFAVVENYPELKANENVLALQEQLTTTENQISFSRQHYNATVLDYNTAIQTFPAVLIAGLARLHQARVLRRRARGRERPERRPQPELTRPPREPDRGRPVVVLRPDLGEQAQLVPARGRRRRAPRRARAARSATRIVGTPAGRRRRDGARAGGRRRSRASAPTSAATSSCSRSAARARSTRRPRRSCSTSSARWRSRPTCRCPQVYLIDDTAPNAFATGRDPQHASVAITTGLLEKLDREELQGVIAHELSHVRNFDIRFSLIVGVLVGAIALLADFFLRFTFWGGVGGRVARQRQRRRRAPGRDLSSSRSCWRSSPRSSAGSSSWRSAASASTSPTRRRVELTRNPYGLERALAKIARRPGGPRGRQPRRPSTCTSRTRSRSSRQRSSGLLSTHPPILDRINRLRELTGEPPLDASDAAALAGPGVGERSRRRGVDGPREARGIVPPADGQPTAG